MTDFPLDALQPVMRTDLRPAYAQIAEQIRRVIRENALTPDTRLPIEAQLVARLGVSRMTVREGIRVLRQEGLLRADHGVGVFVAAGEPTWAPVQIGGALVSSEPEWRELVISALSERPQTGRVEEGYQLWVDSMLKSGGDEVARVSVEISQQPSRNERVHLYVKSPAERSVEIATEAMHEARSWSVSVRAVGPGDGVRTDGELFVSRTALSLDGVPLLVARSLRSGSWAVTTSEAF